MEIVNSALKQLAHSLLLLLTALAAISVFLVVYRGSVIVFQGAIGMLVTVPAIPYIILIGGLSIVFLYSMAVFAALRSMWRRYEEGYYPLVAGLSGGIVSALVMWILASILS